ncbi:MAG: alpha/beta fold hydrolase [Candidatus Rokubacteria bacterium]|nr:alpha/beta fold hydrolase [Candidatus Rokubacteria bacterium]
MEQIGDLLLEHLAPAGRARPFPLLFVHGMWGGSWYLRSYLDAAARDGWNAWAVNLRGHHGSRPVPDLGRVSVLDYVEDVRDCLRALGEAVVIGHSMGGLVAQKVAEGGGVKAAVVLTSAAPRGIVVLRWAVLSRMGRYLGPMLSGRAFGVTAAHARALLLNRIAPDRQAVLYSQFGPESGRAARELAFGLVPVDARRVRCPVLVVGAEHDVITPPAVQTTIARRYGAEYLEAAGHGHMLMLEDDWEPPFNKILVWLGRATHKEKA